MTRNYTIDRSDGITTIQFHQEPSLKDIQHAIDDVASDRANELRLWDLTSGGLSLRGPELRQLGEYGKSKLHHRSKVAIVAPEDLAFGLARMLEVYREAEAVRHMVFRTVHEARAWLLE